MNQLELFDHNVLQLAQKYGYDPRHASFVKDQALFLFDSTVNLHNLSDTERKLLEHACILHDIGTFINEKKHHKHSYYLIRNDLALKEYPKELKKILALVCYNHRKKIKSKTFKLKSKDKNMTLILSAILRLADSFDYSGEEIQIKGIKIEDDLVRIVVDGIITPTLLSRVEKKGELFLYLFELQKIEIENKVRVS
ncbi:HD domain-containing protein [Caldicellulosiruptor acetigenus]|uniref:HD domain-containing protein n=1 Tax=Caldicellulosiruptor acetigenus TaxID=301953 RepID=UPI000404BFE8|nr:HD domain-containing protein [Caldicellulosiruptor acetigenus]WAM36066.1 HD domain-containing protein [Caldicellulosiruptor acetigenus]